MLYGGQINVQSGINAHLCLAHADSRTSLRCRAHFNTQEHFTPEKHPNLPKGGTLELLNPNPCWLLGRDFPPAPSPLSQAWAFLVLALRSALGLLEGWTPSYSTPSPPTLSPSLCSAPGQEEGDKSCSLWVVT